MNPVQAMVEVGVQREQQLAQGVQKVNSYFEQISGLDVARDVDKQHVQNKLNELKTGITTQLSGDFSDQRIVNQISGAANQIYKDPTIQNAVISTASLRKGSTEMDEARKKGENGPANDYYFNRKSQEYLSSTDPNASFNYKYEKYNNNQKEVESILKAISPSGTLTDEAFTTDKNGNRVLADSVIRNGFKGVKPEQIRAALRAGLSPQAWRQYELDGVYNFSNLPPEQFASTVQKEYASVADQYKEKIRLIDNAVTTSGPEKAKLQEQKDTLIKELGQLKNEYDGVTSTFAFGDTDSGKAKLHTLRSINNLAAAYSYGEIQHTYQGDTPQQMEKWRQDKAQDWNKFSLKYQQDERQFELNRADKKKELDLKEKELKGNFGSLSTPFGKDETPAITMEKFKETTDAIGNEIKSNKDQFISLNNLNPNSTEGKDWYNARMQNFLQKGGAGLTAVEREHFQAVADKQKEYDSNLAVASTINQEIANNPDFKKINDFIPKDAKTVIYREGSSNYQYSPQDFIAFNSKRNKYIIDVPSAGTGGAGDTRVDFAKAKAELTDKEYKLFEISFNGPKDASQATVRQYMDNYRVAVNQPYQQELAKQRDFVDQKLNEKVLINQATVTGIPITNPKDKSNVNNLISQFSIYADTHNGKIGNTSSEDLNKLLKDGDKTVSYQTSLGTRFQQPVNNLIITGSDGSTHTIPLTETQRQEVFGNSYTATPEQKAFAPIAQQIQKSGGYSTSMAGKPYLNAADFKSVKNYGVQADVIKSPTSGKYTLQISVYDPITNALVPNISFPAQGLIDDTKVVDVLNRLDDQAIFQLINNRVPSAQELNALQQAAQKPNY